MVHTGPTMENGLTGPLAHFLPGAHLLLSPGSQGPAHMPPVACLLLPLHRPLSAQVRASLHGPPGEGEWSHHLLGLTAYPYLSATQFLQSTLGLLRVKSWVGP